MKLKVTSWSLRWFHHYEMEGKWNMCKSEAGQQWLDQRTPRHLWLLRGGVTYFNSRDRRNSETVAWILHQSESSGRIAPAAGGLWRWKEKRQHSLIPSAGTLPPQRFTFHYDDLFIDKVNILDILHNPLIKSLERENNQEGKHLLCIRFYYL